MSVWPRPCLAGTHPSRGHRAVPAVSIERRRALCPGSQSRDNFLELFCAAAPGAAGAAGISNTSSCDTRQRSAGRYKAKQLGGESMAGTPKTSMRVLPMQSAPQHSKQSSWQPVIRWPIAAPPDAPKTSPLAGSAQPICSSIRLPKQRRLLILLTPSALRSKCAVRKRSRSPAHDKCPYRAFTRRPGASRRAQAARGPSH